MMIMYNTSTPPTIGSDSVLRRGGAVRSGPGENTLSRSIKS